MFVTSLLAAFLAACTASPLSTSHVVHESRSSVPHGWAKRDALNRRTILPMRIALAQSNLEKGEEWLMDVSHPESEKYGQHWSAADVAAAFAPR